MFSKLDRITEPYYNNFKNTNLKKDIYDIEISLHLNKKNMVEFEKTNIYNSKKMVNYLTSEKMITLDSHDVSKYKLQDIKVSLIYYNQFLPSNSFLKMHISGNKSSLFDRLLLHFKKIHSSIIIQKIFRGHCVRYCHRLRFVDSRENNKINDWLIRSTNQTDFFSLDPIQNISYQLLYFYMDKKGFIYTFNIYSLLQYFLQNKGNLINPYNREKIENESFYRFYKLGLLTFYLYSSYLPPLHNEYHQFIYHINKVYDSKFTEINKNNLNRNRIKSNRELNRSCNNRDDNIDFISVNINSIQNHLLSNNFMTQEELIIENLIQIRNKSLNSRIINAFIEIDNLGGYHTNHTWFTDLNKNMLVRFYKNYFKLWYDSPELLNSTKYSICIFRNPFLHLEYLDNIGQVSLDEYREACIYLIENMIYAGIDDEHRKLGAFQVLTILSQVSLSARIGLGYG